jgi:adenylate cyclase
MQWTLGMAAKVEKEAEVPHREAPDLERRLAAILAADVEGYSRLMHHDEEATMLTLSARRTVVDNLLTRFL